MFHPEDKRGADFTWFNGMGEEMIKAIPTIYKGYEFRSRLEAKWAYFLDQLDIKWVYEPEGYILNDGTKYLPDFYLPDFEDGMYAEVKPINGDFSKSKEFFNTTKLPIIYLEGEPDFRVYNYYILSKDNNEPYFLCGIINGDVYQYEKHKINYNCFFVYPGYENEDGTIDEDDYDMAFGDKHIQAILSTRRKRFGD